VLTTPDPCLPAPRTRSGARACESRRVAYHPVLAERRPSRRFSTRWRSAARARTPGNLTCWDRPEPYVQDVIVVGSSGRACTIASVSRMFARNWCRVLALARAGDRAGDVSRIPPRSRDGLLRLYDVSQHAQASSERSRGRCSGSLIGEWMVWRQRTPACQGIEGWTSQHWEANDTSLSVKSRL
jgi:hypothetical protein